MVRTFKITVEITDAEWLALEDFAVCNMSWTKANRPLEFEKSRRAVGRLWHKINKEIYKTKKFKETQRR